MTTLTQVDLDVLVGDMGEPSTIPMLRSVNTRNDPPRSALEEDDELYLGYRFVKSAFPYLAQDNYSRSLSHDKLPGVVLENQWLRASFAPSMGGKLWSLFDKNAGKELLFANPVVRPANLATRNAWCSGGVEWNCGIPGHTPLTCEPLFTCTLKMDDGTPVLRMYEFERIRGVVYQMDFWLPSDSRVLFARMRVVNPSFRDTAMYWWSNIAVPTVDGARVVVPADEAYTPVDGATSTVQVPVRNGIDVTYPQNNPVSVDYFFKTDKKGLGFTCQLDKDGYGLFEASTSRLKGRKIFVWGQGPGGRKWQEYLSGLGHNGQYCEIQCGLAHTQGECLPMAPATAWEWLEIYGPLQANARKVHDQDWGEARSAAAGAIEQLMSAEQLEQALDDTRRMALTKADTMLRQGAGWGALENLRRVKEGLGAMCPHLDFRQPGAPQQPWVTLLEKGTMGEHDANRAPVSWMRQTEWTLLMEHAAENADKDNWYTLLQLGCTWLAKPDLLRAEYYVGRSLAVRKTAWGLYANAELLRIAGEEAAAGAMMIAAADLASHDASLAKAAAGMLHQIRDYEALARFAAARPQNVRDLPRIRLFAAFAEATLGRHAKAETLLRPDGQWLEVPDIREGEVSLSDLWYLIEEGKALAENRPFDRSQHSPPYALDFRMFAVK